ncbi:uncharacterized protein PV09_00765 [Verruconis gallopava]|uniref:Uncharacterized protein n=1 Tax=Verruconis gallopava TaxID=253628 RepID=A0A0D1Y187_9PEZI|nr:uncharacterized protein PV09_00765 [Verruconis gallopava]KIW08836.1 hypothetical protein PV09_00765 [Verruconis gallopava]
MSYIHAYHLAKEVNVAHTEPSDWTVNYMRSGQNYKKFLGNEWRQEPFLAAVDREFIEEKIAEQTSDDEEDDHGYIITKKQLEAALQPLSSTKGNMDLEEATEGFFMSSRQEIDIETRETDPVTSFVPEKSVQQRVLGKIQPRAIKLEHHVTISNVSSPTFLASSTEDANYVKQSEISSGTKIRIFLPGGNIKKRSRVIEDDDAEIPVQVKLKYQRDKTAGKVDIERRAVPEQKIKRGTEDEANDKETHGTGDSSFDASTWYSAKTGFLDTNAINLNDRKVSNESMRELKSKTSRGTMPTLIGSLPSRALVRIGINKTKLARVTSQPGRSAAVSPLPDLVWGGIVDAKAQEHDKNEDEIHIGDSSKRQRLKPPRAYTGKSRREITGRLASDPVALKYKRPKNDSTDPEDKPWEVIHNPKPMVRKSAQRRNLDVTDPSVQASMLTLKFRHKQDAGTILTYTYESPRDWGSQQEVTGLIKKIGQDRRRESGSTTRPRPGYQTDEIEWLARRFEERPEIRGRDGMSVARFKMLAADYNDVFRSRQAQIASKHKDVEVGPRSWHGIMSVCDRNRRILAARGLLVDTAQEGQQALSSGDSSEVIGDNGSSDQVEP